MYKVVDYVLSFQWVDINYNTFELTLSYTVIENYEVLLQVNQAIIASTESPIYDGLQFRN